ANLSLDTVLIAVGAMLVALSVLRMSRRDGDRTVDWLVENLQVVLSVVVVVFLIIRPHLFQAFYIPSSSMEPTLMGPPLDPPPPPVKLFVTGAWVLIGAILLLNVSSLFRGLEASAGRALALVGVAAVGLGVAVITQKKIIPRVVQIVRNQPAGNTGDRLLVNKLIYRVSDPKREDIAVFRAPEAASPDEKEFIKRVIGVPGDTVEVAPPRMMVDGKVLFVLTNDGPTSGISLAEEKEPQVDPEGRTAELVIGYGSASLKIIADPHAEVRYDPFEVSVDGKVELRDGGNIVQVSGFGAYGGDPTLEGTVYTVGGDPRLAIVRGKKMGFDAGHVEVNGERLNETYIKEAPRYTMAARKLGPRQYFMMGDNRNNSNDSHAWGPLARERMIGRAEVLFWPMDRFRIFHWWLVVFLTAVFLGYQVMLRVVAPK
ncbi:MAG: signal peptidase I, partial [Actinomycetota bacterium]